MGMSRFPSELVGYFSHGALGLINRRLGIACGIQERSMKPNIYRLGFVPLSCSWLPAGWVSLEIHIMI
jgi:hypothetical protein